MKGNKMKKIIPHVLAAAAMVMAVGSSQAADAEVYFTPLNTFTDMPLEAAERAEVLIKLSKHFDKLAAKLPAGQKLRVIVTDMDLAGENWRDRTGLRNERVIIGHNDWPELKMTYSITENGKVVEEGQEYLKDMGFGSRANVYFAGDQLRYEKQMLDLWFSHRIAGR